MFLLIFYFSLLKYTYHYNYRSHISLQVAKLAKSAGVHANPSHLTLKKNLCCCCCTCICMFFLYLYVYLYVSKCLVLSVVVPVHFICFTVGEWETSYRFLCMSEIDNKATLTLTLKIGRAS